MDNGSDKKDVVYTEAQQVYETLLNTLTAEYRIPWAEPIFVPGHPCFESYCDMHRAYERLRERLEENDEILEAEEMIDHLLEHGRLLALEMFRYGMLYQKMQDERKPGA